MVRKETICLGDKEDEIVIERAKDLSFCITLYNYIGDSALVTDIPKEKLLEIHQVISELLKE